MVVSASGTTEPEADEVRDRPFHHVAWDALRPEGAHKERMDDVEVQALGAGADRVLAARPLANHAGDILDCVDCANRQWILRNFA